MSHTINGNCHCGAVEFEVQLDSDIEFGARCNCSLCRRKGALMYPIAIEQFSLVKGEINLAVYQWGTRKARHYFCKTCGIYTHHQRFVNNREYCFNLGCVDQIDTGKLPVKWVDGSAI